MSDSRAPSRIRICLTCLHVFRVNEAMLNTREFGAASYEYDLPSKQLARKFHARIDATFEDQTRQRARSPELPLCALENHANVTSTADRGIDNGLDFQWPPDERERKKGPFHGFDILPTERERERETERE